MANKGIIPPTDTSAMSLGKQPARSGEIKGANTAQSLPMSDPVAVARQGSPSAEGPLAAKKRAALRRG